MLTIEQIDIDKPLPLGTVIAVTREMAIEDDIVSYLSPTSYGYYITMRSGSYRRSIKRHAYHTAYPETTLRDILGGRR